MREHLCRGFHPGNGTTVITLNGNKIKGKWIEGYYVYTEDCHKIYFPEGPDANRCEYHHVFSQTVCKCTGLTDKNGKKIFEGDIVAFRYGHNKDICSVSFEQGAFGLGQHKRFDYDELEASVHNATEMYPSFVGNDNFISLWEIAWNYQECGADDNLHLLEVIGNIYENSELLK